LLEQGGTLRKISIDARLGYQLVVAILSIDIKVGEEEHVVGFIHHKVVNSLDRFVN